MSKPRFLCVTYRCRPRANGKGPETAPRFVQQGPKRRCPREKAATKFRVRRWQWWRDAMLPGVLPCFITGAITASGGAWNAAIVAESVSWGKTTITAHGLGAYIAQATAAGDFPRLVLGITVMSLIVTLFNRVIWRPLYRYAEERARLS
jgi:NitT/TauT family transport system permease protein